MFPTLWRTLLSTLLIPSFIFSPSASMAQDSLGISPPISTPDANRQVSDLPLFMPLIASAPEAVDGTAETICTLAVGSAGIHYEIGPDVPPWGPSTLTLGPDQSFWIADAAANRLLQLDAACALVSTISLDGLTIAPIDLALGPDSLWVLDISAQVPTVLNLTYQGELITRYPLPEEIGPAAGLSGITLSPGGEVLLEQENGAQYLQLVTEGDSPFFAAASGFMLDGQAIQALSGGINSANAGSGYITTGSAEIAVKVENDLGGLHILGVAPANSFYAVLEEVALRDTILVDQRIHHYTQDGVMLGEARAPVQSQYTYVPHALAIDEEGSVYFLATYPDRAEIQRLHFTKALPPVIPPLVAVAKVEGVTETAVAQIQSVEPDATPLPPVESFATPLPASPDSDAQSSSPLTGDTVQGCTINRDQIMANANAFINNRVTLSEANVNGACTYRGKPRYISGPGPYSSVPYDWGGKVSIATFNTRMSEGRQAGDYTADTTYGQACSVGVDCSGFIARVWNVPAFDATCCENVGTSKLTTYSTVLASTNELQRGDVLNNSTSHVAMFDSFGTNGFYSYEATTSWTVDRVYKGFRDWTWITNNSYLPYKLKSDYLCNSADPDDGRSIGTNQSLNGTINPANDVDTYTLNASQGQLVEIRTTRTSGNLDSYLYLYNTNGSLLDSDDDDGGNLNSMIRWTLPTTGRYTIKVKSYGSATTGGYRLSVTTAQAPATPSNLRAVALDSSRVRLTWTDNSNNEANFVIYDGSNYVNSVGANVVSYTATGLAANSYHCYRVYAINSAGTSSWSEWACVTLPSGSSGNLALNKSASASSLEQTAYAPYKAADGSQSTRWSSMISSTLGQQWWRVDLGSVRTFSRVVVRWEYAYATQFFVGWSDDGTNFTGYNYSASSAGVTSHNLGTQNHRYVAVFMFQRAPRMNNYSIWEVEVYNGSTALAAGEFIEDIPADSPELVHITIPADSEAALENPLYLPAMSGD